MFFVIAGVQPKTRTLDQPPQRCPRCGLYQAYTQQVDHYLSLFFLPLVRVKKGEPFLFCRRCDQPVSEASGKWPPNGTTGSAQPQTCSRCGRTLQADMAYCPFCGQRQ